MTRLDWNLLTIAAAEGQPLSPVQLQKSLFLFERAFPEELRECGYQFAPYDYGPFSVAVYHDAERLAGDGYVTITQTPGGWFQYAATGAGLRANASKMASWANLLRMSLLKVAVIPPATHV